MLCLTRVTRERNLLCNRQWLLCAQILALTEREGDMVGIPLGRRLHRFLPNRFKQLRIEDIRKKMYLPCTELNIEFIQMNR